MPPTRLAEKISECRICDGLGIVVTHCPPMERGTGTKVMVVGEEPGNTEAKSGKAFSGASGKRLMGWLAEAGLGETREEIFRNAYFSSLCKCKIAKKRDFRVAAGRCAQSILFGH